VQAGFFFPCDAYVPRSAVSPGADGRLTQTVGKEEALNQRWSSPPAGTDRDQETAILAAGDRVRPDQNEGGG